jgi:hypothetical protein
MSSISSIIYIVDDEPYSTEVVFSHTSNTFNLYRRLLINFETSNIFSRFNFLKAERVGQGHDRSVSVLTLCWRGGQMQVGGEPGDNVGSLLSQLEVTSHVKHGTVQSERGIAWLAIYNSLTLLSWESGTSLCPRGKHSINTHLRLPDLRIFSADTSDAER